MAHFSVFCCFSVSSSAVSGLCAALTARRRVHLLSLASFEEKRLEDFPDVDLNSKAPKVFH